MKRILTTALVLGVGICPALAGDTPSAREIRYIQNELAAWDCYGGDIEREERGRGYYYEVDDAECPGGEYEIKLNSRFRIFSMERD